MKAIFYPICFIAIVAMVSPTVATPNTSCNKASAPGQISCAFNTANQTTFSKAAVDAARAQQQRQAAANLESLRSAQAQLVAEQQAQARRLQQQAASRAKADEARRLQAKTQADYDFNERKAIQEQRRQAQTRSEELRLAEERRQAANIAQQKQLQDQQLQRQRLGEQQRQNALAHSQNVTTTQNTTTSVHTLNALAASFLELAPGTLRDQVGAAIRRAQMQGTVASSPINRSLLHNQLAVQEATSQLNKPLAGAGVSAVHRDAHLYAQTYGGAVSDWNKMTSGRAYSSPEGSNYQLHWVENARTGQQVDLKIKN